MAVMGMDYTLKWPAEFADVAGGVKEDTPLCRQGLDWAPRRSVRSIGAVAALLVQLVGDHAGGVGGMIFEGKIRKSYI
jgi:hypothetical protein